MPGVDERIAALEARVAELERWRKDQREAARALLDQYAPRKSGVTRLVEWARRNRE